MKASILGLATVAMACHSTAAPQGSLDAVRFSSQPVTVRVTNTLSVALDIRGYPSLDPPMPQLLGGMLRLGEVAAASSACLAIPDTLLITGTVVGSGEVDTTVWTSAQPLSLTGLDLHAGLQTGGQTAEFTPTASAGWQMTLPAAGTGPTATTPCTP